MPPTEQDYRDSFTFLKLHTDVVELAEDHGEGRVLVAPDLAGRIMTSTAKGFDGESLGWINRPAIVSSQADAFPHAGGEQWLCLNGEASRESPFEVVDLTESSVRLGRRLTLAGPQDAPLGAAVERSVRLLPRDQLRTILGAAPPRGMTLMGYETRDTLMPGAPSPQQDPAPDWSLTLVHCFGGADDAAVLLPYGGDESDGPVPVRPAGQQNDVPGDRLCVTDACVLFRGDGRRGGRIGIGPSRTCGRIGRIDLSLGVLTVISFDVTPDARYARAAPPGATDPWQAPVAAASCNHGGGAERFYTLETAAPVHVPARDGMRGHTQTTIHCQGSEKMLDALLQSLFRVGIRDVAQLF